MKSLKEMWNRILFRKYNCKYFGENGECTISFIQTGPNCGEYECCNKICEIFEVREKKCN